MYSRDAILRSLYWFTDRVYVHVSQSSPSQFEITMEPKERGPSDLSRLAGEFLNAVLDQSIRESIQRETGRIREILVAKAFAEPGLLEDPPSGEVVEPSSDDNSGS
jgi:His-Xaa-Ser system protein HxsD